MTQTIVVILVSAAIFLALILFLAFDIENPERWNRIAFSVAILGGLLIYGSINAKGSNIIAVAVLRTIIDIGKMFGGGNRFEDFVELLGDGIGWSIFFWAVHFFAYYALVSTIFIVLGKGAVRKLRMLIMSIRDIEVIYGTDDQAVLFGKKLSENKNVAIVFVGENLKMESSIRRMGGILYSDASSLSASSKFLKKLAVKKDKGTVRLNAISEDPDANLSFALKFLKTLESNGITSKQTSLVLLGSEKEDGISLLATKGKYGYGSVKPFERAELSARLLFQKYPVCNQINFDDHALAQNDAECILVGFSHIGQEVLRKLIANAQFEGSSFHVKVYDPDIDRMNGVFKLRYSGMLDEYAIDFDPHDVRSLEAAEYISKKASSLAYIVIALSDESKGRAIAHSISDILEQNACELPIYQCGKDKVIAYYNGKESEKHSIFDADILYHGAMDELAVQINHFYRDETEDPQDQWAECDFFSRMSCRASADYLSALIRRLDLSKHELDEQTMENLGRTEHLRWNAFHFSMGYSLMSDEIIKEREKLFKEDPTVRVTRDSAKKLHACLVKWDELDELSRYETELTGKEIDYKKMDRDNVFIVKKLMDNGALTKEKKHSSRR